MNETNLKLHCLLGWLPCILRYFRCELGLYPSSSFVCLCVLFCFSIRLNPCQHGLHVFTLVIVICNVKNNDHFLANFEHPVHSSVIKSQCRVQLSCQVANTAVNHSESSPRFPPFDSLFCNLFAESSNPVLYPPGIY